MNVQAVLTESLRPPSAHNAQPSRITPRADGGYELHYDHLDYLPFDPDDRDAYLAMGAFLETMNLAAQRHGLIAGFTPVFSRNGIDLYVGSVRFGEADARPADPLAEPAADRHTNRQPYDRTPLPDELRTRLTALGCALVPPGQMARLVRKASVLSWNDRRFVADLDRWISADPDAKAGMTAAGLPLSRLEWTGLRVALRLGRLPAPLARVAAARDIRLLAQAQAVGVLGAADLTPPVLAEAPAAAAQLGRDQRRRVRLPPDLGRGRPAETAPQVAATAGVPVPVAVFRIGRPRREAPRSNRRDLADVLRPRLSPPVAPRPT